ncbi:hypothetical protein [Streptomyces sp. GMY02]|uniref:hypothetical protein n=1 Tax=Streptomyces sp. GMY02 TaxID=1333528 RepID=UPI0020B72B3D|nr:hypothetical protein [Streptomyces sp. GMY02]
MSGVHLHGNGRFRTVLMLPVRRLGRKRVAEAEYADLRLGPAEPFQGAPQKFVQPEPRAAGQVRETGRARGEDPRRHEEPPW